MKKILLLLVIIPLLGVTKVQDSKKVERYKTDTRPTIEQELQMAKNELANVSSRIDVKIAEFKNK